MNKANYHISYGAQSAGVKCDVDVKQSFVYFLQRKLSCSLQFVDFTDQRRKRFKSVFWRSSYQKTANSVLDTQYTNLTKASFISEYHTVSSCKVNCNHLPQQNVWLSVGKLSQNTSVLSSITLRFLAPNFTKIGQ
jgi:hypothetical protein